MPHFIVPLLRGECLEGPLDGGQVMCRKHAKSGAGDVNPIFGTPARGTWGDRKTNKHATDMPTVTEAPPGGGLVSYMHCAVRSVFG